MTCIRSGNGNGWSYVTLDDTSKSWFDTAKKEDIVGAIGVTINDRKDRPLFHRLTTFVSKLTHFFRNLNKGLELTPKNAGFDANKSTHAFVVVGTKKDKDKDTVIEVADADDAGVLRHDYDKNKALDHEKTKDDADKSLTNEREVKRGWYSKIALIIPPKEIRERISTIAKCSSSNLEMGNILTEIELSKIALEKKSAKIDKLVKELKILKKKKFASTSQGTLQELGNIHNISKLERTIHIKQDDRLAILEKLNLNEMIAKELIGDTKYSAYNNKGLITVGIAGKLPFLSVRPFFKSLSFFGKRDIQQTAFRNYISVLEGKTISTKTGDAKAMICSEFASKMLKMAIIDLTVEEKIGSEKYKKLKSHLERCNTVLENSKASKDLKKAANEHKQQILSEYAESINEVIVDKIKKHKLFRMKDSGIVPGELLTLGFREIQGV